MCSAPLLLNIIAWLGLVAIIWFELSVIGLCVWNLMLLWRDRELDEM